MLGNNCVLPWNSVPTDKAKVTQDWLGDYSPECTDKDSLTVPNCYVLCHAMLSCSEASKHC